MLVPGPSRPSPAVRPLRVAVVNDYAVVVAGIVQMLQAHGLEVVELDVGGARVGGAADVVLCDTFAQPAGVTLAHLGRLDRTSARWIVFTWSTDPGLVASAMEAGAAGFVAKSVTASELVEAIERVHRGERLVLVHDQVDGVDGHTHAHGRWPGREVGLSPREAEVLALICRGLSNAEIAEQLFLGVNTIKTYIRAAYRKIDVDRRSQAVIWGFEHGLDPVRSRSAGPGEGRGW